jgi:hypothetical protein
MSTDQPYRNETTQAERLRVLLQDASTYAAHTAVDQAGGRFAVQSKTAVTGSRPVQQWPTIPSGPWSGPCPSGQEPPTGYDYAVDLGEPLSAPKGAPTPIEGSVSVNPEPQLFRRRV